MEINGREEQTPVSPTGQYFNSSVLSIGVLAAMESEIPIDDSSTMTLLTNVFLPINPRFSSLMITDEHGIKQWKPVPVKLNDHVNVPIYDKGLSPEYYDEVFQDYLSKIALEKLPQSRPLWEIHIFKYPTSSAAGTLIFKLHHALGDGFSLMGALFSCFQRADDASLPITFPSSQADMKPAIENRGVMNIVRHVPKVFSMVANTTLDFAWSLMKSSILMDDKTPIRSGTDGVDLLPLVISTVTFSLEQLKEIKTKLGATINDVITGVIFYGTRLYMKAAAEKGESPSKNNATALVLLNTRIINTYKSISEMAKPDSDSPWGNQFGFLHVAVPESSIDAERADPLEFVNKAKEMIKRKRGSLAVILTGRLLEAMRKLRGHETTAQYIHSTLHNTSMTISNMIGPLDRIALADHPCAGIYFMVVGVPQSLTITMVSYMGKLRVAVGAEKGFINHKLFNSCLEKAFEKISEAACPQKFLEFKI